MPTPEESREILEDRFREIENSHRSADERIIANLEHKLKISEERVKIGEGKIAELQRRLDEKGL